MFILHKFPAISQSTTEDDAGIDDDDYPDFGNPDTLGNLTNSQNGTLSENASCRMLMMPKSLIFIVLIVNAVHRYWTWMQ